MKLQAYRLQNYRRLRDVVIELDDEISVSVQSAHLEFRAR